jgi:methylmalonyl-CoA mutase C-terminal domain/subunit
MNDVLVKSTDEKQMRMDRKIRVLAGKPGLDGHDRGIKVVCNALREGGMEVIYTGLRQTPEQIVNAALQEDVDVVALSILSGAHDILLPKVADLLRKGHGDHIMVVAGGIIPKEDIPLLKERGILEVFGPGTTTKEIVTFIKAQIAKKKDARSSEYE